MIAWPLVTPQQDLVVELAKRQDQIVSLTSKLAEYENQNFATLPIEPPRELLISMALRMHHDFGVDKGSDMFPGMGFTPEEREMVLKDMARVYEEVVGTGFYRNTEESRKYYRRFVHED